MVEQAEVAMTPGAAFGPRGEGYVRLAPRRERAAHPTGHAQPQQGLATPATAVG